MKVKLACDDCGYRIESAGDGELAWARDDEARERVLVVHVPAACPRWTEVYLCVPERIPGRITKRLDVYLGRQGLLELLALIERRDLSLPMGVELIRRLHVPGYEQYRLFRRELIESEADEELPAVPDRAAYQEFLALKTAIREQEDAG